MCGIVGIVSVDGRHPSPFETVRSMAARVRHRGPDADGFHDLDGVHLGMRRLSIIDLKTGDQPIYNEDRSIAVVYNGEIYNYVALRRRLLESGHVFTTETDSEVIAHLYEEDGMDAFGQLNGMYAIALHDAKRGLVVVVRDPVGIKPLYWTRDSLGVRFASELKAVFVDPHVSRQPNLAGLSDYLTNWYVPTPQSAFAGIRKLNPGHTLSIRANGEVEERPFSRPNRSKASSIGSREEAVEAATAALEDSVERQLVADVPVGIFLSGGLDSAIVAVLAARHARERMCAFTVSFDDHSSYDEAPVAKAISEFAGLEHIILRFPNDPTDWVRRTLDTFDEPFGDYSGVPMTFLCEGARQHVKVCLAGDGGDEVFAGYTHYLAPSFAKFFRRMPAFAQRAVGRLVRAMPTSFDRISLDFMAKRFVRGAPAHPLEAHLLYKAIFFGAERDRLLGPALASVVDRDPLEGVRAALQSASESGSNLLRQLLNLDRATFLLDDNLVKVDRTSMASSLEVRVPMLDQVVVDTADQIPPSMMLRRGVTKSVLREVARRVLPKSVARLKKRGFTPPMPEWLSGPLSPLVADLLAPSAVRQAGLVQPEFVSAAIGEHQARRRDRSRELWTLLSLHDWWKKQAF